MATETVTRTAAAAPTAPTAFPIPVQTHVLPSALELVDERSDVPEWMRELRTRGWTVVPGVLSPEKARAYADQAYGWLESWGLGYDRHDPATHTADKLPWCARGGLYSRHGIGHEQFVWDLRTEPALIDAFARIWGTDELAVSYDGVNMSVPDRTRAASDPIFAPWAHVDQSPYRKNLQCVQGILNLLPNGPQDGGLTVLDGSRAHYVDLWDAFADTAGRNGWSTSEFQLLTAEMNDWLLARGCRWVKVCAGPGDLLLWDSRTVHYGSVPTGTSDRFAAYVCYKPAAFVPEEARQKRLAAFEQKNNTAHDPAVVRINLRYPPEEHPTYEQAVHRPLQNPVLSKRARLLAGLDKYESS